MNPRRQDRDASRRRARADRARAERARAARTRADRARLARTPADRGAGTVLMLGVVVAAATMTMVVALIGSALVARQRAQAAADLAALAAAAAGDCGPGRSIAARNGARLTACTAGGDGSRTVEVTVAVTRTVAGGPLVARARARAGPAP